MMLRKVQNVFPEGTELLWQCLMAPTRDKKDHKVMNNSLPEHPSDEKFQITPCHKLCVPDEAYLLVVIDIINALSTFFKPVLSINLSNNEINFWECQESHPGPLDDIQE